jgi:NAD(P)-dependent dehydrogenase (short-subunit alcohol dehydrogenase family)
MRLLDRVAIVTGGAGGLGSGICRALAEEGARVGMIVNSNLPGGHRLAEEIETAYGKKPLVLKADVSKAGDVKEAVESVYKQWGKIDILVNNAGITTLKKIEEISELEWDHVINVNLKGHFLFAQCVIPYLKQQGGGKIINMGSLVAKNGGIISGGVYACSKGAIHSLTYALAKELAPYGIAVNAVAPGPIKTSMVQNMPPEKLKSLVEMIPLKRFGDVMEVARTIVFLASDDAGFITGEVVDINGGLYTD